MLTAAALTLTLSAGPAIAADSSQPAVTADAQRSGERATGANLQPGRAIAHLTTGGSTTAVIADVTSVKGYSALVGHPTYNYIDLELQGTNGADIEYFEVVLSVGGVEKGTFEVFWDEDEEVNYIQIPGNIGLGKAKFTSTIIHYTPESGQSPTIDPTTSNTFYVRKYIDAKDPALKIVYTSKKKSFYVKGVKIFVPSSGTYKSLGKIKLQRKSSPKGKWSTKKTIKLDGNGNGKYSYKTKTKYYYRIYAPVSDTSGGLYTKTSKKL